jgi:protein arginine kinase
MVLSSLPSPAWLAQDAPHNDVVLSSRVRVMRNLVGYRFPHQATLKELTDVQKLILASLADRPFEVNRHLSVAERDHLVGCRLMSPDFLFDAPGRAILLDTPRTTGIMVNEEDHFRLQTLTGGWSPENAASTADEILEFVSRRLDFAWSPHHGYLAASPFNAGEGRRLSAMFHLIGLAHTKRLPGVLRALNAKGIASRGLFGESSRAIGAFLQVSITDTRKSDFIGAGDYLLREERAARHDVGRDELAERAKQAIDFAISSPTISLSDSFRVLGWARWAAVAGISGVGYSPRQVDSWLTVVELQSAPQNDKVGQARASFLRECLESG